MEKTMQANEVRTSATVGMTWQRGAVWLARAGYSDLELTAFMTVRRVAASRRSAPVPRPLPLPVAAVTERLAFSAAD
jgi:hypothetical protein